MAIICITSHEHLLAIYIIAMNWLVKIVASEISTGSFCLFDMHISFATYGMLIGSALPRVSTKKAKKQEAKRQQQEARLQGEYQCVCTFIVYCNSKTNLSLP